MSSGAFHYQKERFAMRSKKIIEDAWLLFQNFNSTKRSVDTNQPCEYETGEINPKELEKLHDQLLSRDFEKVSQAM